MSESHTYSFLKAISWRAFGTLATMILVYLFTGAWTVSVYVGLLEMMTKIVLFYVHERLWLWFKQLS